MWQVPLFCVIDFKSKVPNGNLTFLNITILIFMILRLKGDFSIETGYFFYFSFYKISQSFPKLQVLHVHKSEYFITKQEYRLMGDFLYFLVNIK